MTRESWRDMAARAVASLGHLVVWSRVPLKVGTVVPSVSTYSDHCTERTTAQPFVIVGEATMEHVVRQTRVMGLLDQSPSADVHYYFVETD